jgi:hypothetical protein
MEMKKAVEELYKSVAIIYGSSRNKWNICKEERKEAFSKQMSFEVGTEDYSKWEKIKDRWNDLSTRLSWEFHYYGDGYGGYGNGARVLLEAVYDALGHDKSNLIDFNKYDGIKIISPLSFSEYPTDEIIALEDSFEDEDDAFRDGDWKDRYIRLFDSTTDDIYRMMGCALYFDSIVDKENIEGDEELALATWNLLIEGSRNFLYYGRNCLAETEINTKSYFEQQMNPKNKNLIRSKYISFNEHKVLTVGGVFCINYDKLPDEWKEKVTYIDIKLGEI